METLISAAALFTGLVVLATAIVTLRRSTSQAQKTQDRVQEVHVLVNSQRDELKERIDQLVEQRRELVDRVDQLADSLKRAGIDLPPSHGQEG